MGQIQAANLALTGRCLFTSPDPGRNLWSSVLWQCWSRIQFLILFCYHYSRIAAVKACKRQDLVVVGNDHMLLEGWGQICEPGTKSLQGLTDCSVSGG